MPTRFTSKPKSKLSKNLKIGVLLGGDSAERKISLRSGRAIRQALRRLGFCTVDVDPRKKDECRTRLRKVDLAFIALHGKGGEDGTIQRYLDNRRIPYVGSDAAGSARAFNKLKAKRIFQQNGVPTPEYTVITPSNWKEVLQDFPAPFFVKPLCDGSSIGVFPVEDLSESAENITDALKKYGELLVEKKIRGREFTVGILGFKALPVIELKPKRPFFDYCAKYTSGMTDYLIPAPIPTKLAVRLQKIALRAHRCLKLRDFSRVDMMADSENHPYVLEVNSIPGFTEMSLLPKAARAAGISFEQLCHRLVFQALQRTRKVFNPKGSTNHGRQTT
ncbi:MAG: D-alanine--D-alanine ligase [Candidatus Omnitrophica bacterium]|nr:D-alanine--D-alanine ligase [Candidatus Omnitrophota bacterium]